MPLTLLEEAWLDTLVSAKHRLPAAELVHYDLAVDSISWLGYKIPERRGGAARVRPINSLAPIELRELLLSLAIALTEAHHDSPYNASRLSWELGCIEDAVYEIPIRWHRMAMRFNPVQIPYLDLETRIACKICTKRIPTGAHYIPGLGEPPGDYGQPRLDLHHECGNYIHTVLLPRRRAALAARKEKGV